VDGTFVVLEAARQQQVRRFIYTASSSCYGIPNAYPTPEVAPADPRYPYALTKYLGEQLVMHWASIYRLPAVSLRFFNVYGPRARTSGTYGAVFGVFLAQLMAGQPLTVVGDGEQTRDFTFVSDIVDALLTVAQSNKSRDWQRVVCWRAVSGTNSFASLVPHHRHLRVSKSPIALGRTLKTGIWAGNRKSGGGAGHVGEYRALARCPVWTAARIADATADWFRFLGKGTAGKSERSE
jgi:UDP-glucose 4-epimerase